MGTLKLQIESYNKSQFVEAIKYNDKEVLNYLYQSNYPKIERLVLGNSGSADYAKDIFQEAFLATWKKVKTDKFLPENESSFNAYLFQVAKYKWLDFLRSNNFKQTVLSDKLAVLKYQKHDLIEEENEQDEELSSGISKVMDAFARLADPCKSLLRKFYFEKKSMKVLAHELDMEDSSIRNKKYRCMQKLREIALNL